MTRVVCLKENLKDLGGIKDQMKSQDCNSLNACKKDASEYVACC